jgi:pilus assembly protein CpaF
MTVRWHPAGAQRRLRGLVADRVRERVDAPALSALDSAERRLRVREEALRVLAEQRVVLSARDVTRLVNEVSDEVVGFGPIERLLKDPDVTEVMVNGPDDVYVERKGRIEKMESGLFEGEEAVLHLIDRIVGPLGLRVDESSPYVDARLPDGSRFHAILPPLSLCGPVLTVRKFGIAQIGPGDLIRLGTATEEMVTYLAERVRRRSNIIVSGGAASGKTTLLGALSSFISDAERIVTIEDAAELRLDQPHVVRLEARTPNVEGRGAVSVRDLVRNALRMRPDRILVGEVRGGEALDMLQAMNTGHEGSMSTVHANSPQDVMSRLETMALMSDVRLPVEHVRAQIAATIDIVVHMARLPNGRRVIARIAEIPGDAADPARVRDVIVFRRDGRFEPANDGGTRGRSPNAITAGQAVLSRNGP